MFYERFLQLKRFLVPAFTKKMAYIACHNMYSIMIKPHFILPNHLPFGDKMFLTRFVLIFGYH
jgi:hypothetical protein